MATFSLGNVPSPINQALRLAQLQEAQNPNLALERQIQQAVELQRIQQQSPEAQLALQIKQAQLAQIPIEAERQNLLTEQIRRELDPVYQAQQDARKLALDVSRATQIANATNKGAKGFFNENLGVWIKEVNGKPVASRIPFEETTEPSLPNVSASDIPSFDPTLFSGTPTASIIPSTPTSRTLTGTIDQRVKTAEEAKKEEQAFRKDLQESAQTFTANQNKLQREYLKGKNEGPEGVYTKQQQASVNQLYDRFNRNDYVKKAQSAQSSVDIILQGLSQNNSTGDIAAINQFQSGLIDPGATVREGDVVLIRNAAPVLARVQNYLPQLLKGGVLPPQMRDEMKKISTQIYNMRAKNAMEIPVKQFKNNAQNAGIQFEDIGQEFNQLAPDGSVISPVATSGINPNAPSPVTPADLLKKHKL